MANLSHGKIHITEIISYSFHADSVSFRDKDNTTFVLSLEELQNIHNRYVLHKLKEFNNQLLKDLYKKEVE